MYPDASRHRITDLKRYNCTPQRAALVRMKAAVSDLFLVINANYRRNTMGSSALKSRICCLDLDTFFVSVERLKRPQLNGQPVVVGALPGNRGVVTAASYEVRAFGVRSGIPISEAYRLAPQAIYVPGRHAEYGKYSRQVKEILERYCPVVRTASIDEFFLDFSGCETLYRKPDDKDDDATTLNTFRTVVAIAIFTLCDQLHGQFTIELTRVADTNTSIPGGIGNSQSVAGLTLDGVNVAFNSRNGDNGNPEGIYTDIGGLNVEDGTTVRLNDGSMTLFIRLWLAKSLII